MARKTPEFKLNEEQQKLAAENINLARREAWKLQRTADIDYDTLEGAALEGLCKAAYRYNPESGFKFSSLAVPTIRGELLHWIRDKTYAMRLTHKMRELWIKGRKLLYKGASDEKVANHLNITQAEWQDIKSVCSGPPLELKEQANPTESLEPDEINFAGNLIDEITKVYGDLSVKAQKELQDYFHGNSNRKPVEALSELIEKLRDIL